MVLYGFSLFLAVLTFQMYQKDYRETQYALNQVIENKKLVISQLSQDLNDLKSKSAEPIVFSEIHPEECLTATEIPSESKTLSNQPLTNQIEPSTISNVVEEALIKQFPTLGSSNELAHHTELTLEEFVRDESLDLSARVDAAIGLVELSERALDANLGFKLLTTAQDSEDIASKVGVLEVLEGSVTEEMIPVLGGLMMSDHESVRQHAYHRLAELPEHDLAREILIESTAEHPSLLYSLFQEIALLSDH